MRRMWRRAMLGRWSQVRLMMERVGITALPGDERRQTDNQSEDCLRFSGKVWGNQFERHHVAGSQAASCIFDVLLRFRKNPVALVADLTEMFSQVVMAKQDRLYQRFLRLGLDLTRHPKCTKWRGCCLVIELHRTWRNTLYDNMLKTIMMTTQWQMLSSFFKCT